MKLIDPLHLFNARGQSLLSADHFETENAKLQAEVTRLNAQVKRLALRLRTIASDKEIHNSINH